MARGWESKSVEAQIEASAEVQGSKKQVTPEEAERMREKASLQLARARVVQQIHNSTNSRYTQMMQQALADIDARLGKLR